MIQKEVSIIIPALNEEQSIEQVVRGLVTSFPDSEIIVVNDGSTDKTEMLANQAGALVINHDSRRGYGAALRSGVLASHAHRLLLFDHQHVCFNERQLRCEVGTDHGTGTQGREYGQAVKTWS